VSVVVSSSINRVALAVAVLLAAGVAWIGVRNGDPLLIVLGIALLAVGPFVRRPDGSDVGAAMRAQIDRLQAMPAPPPDPAAGTDPVGATPNPGISPPVRALILSGQKIQAIKRYREEYGSGLKDAKDAVEEFERQLGYRS
jgi:hypothetical protein